MTETSRSEASMSDPSEPAASPGAETVHPAGEMEAAATDAESGLLHLAVRWWPALAGLALGLALLIDIEPWRPTEPTTVLLPGLAIAYLVFGAVRGQLRRRGVLRLQTVGLVIYGGCALVAVLVDPAVGHYIAGAGWIAHAAWDVAHHRDLSHHHAVGVVPRGYAEFCIVADLLIGAALIAAPAA
jgi:hypothetical protein